MNKILTIIVTYNGMNWIERCLKSLMESTIPTDIYIVDNGSTDGTIEYIQENFSQAVIHLSPKNLGFGGANNIGLQYAMDHNYEFIYLLNQDAWIKHDTLHKLVSTVSSNPQFGILSPLQLNAEENLVDKNFFSSCSRELFSDSVLSQNLQDVYETDFVMAAHWLITRKCLESVGLFSPTFFHYGEDNNYIDRAKYHSFKVGIAPHALAIHDREERPVSPEKQDYLFYVSHLIRLSNPNMDASTTSTIAYYLSRILGHGRLKCVSYLYKTLSDITRIKRNKTKSKELRAFIN